MVLCNHILVSQPNIFLIDKTWKCLLIKTKRNRKVCIDGGYGKYAQVLRTSGYFIRFSPCCKNCF